MKQVNIETSGAGCDWIYSSLFATLKTNVAELGAGSTILRQDKLDDIIRIAETMREVCVARDNAREV